MIKGGECIRLFASKEVKPTKALDFPLKVLFEDEHLALVHKPAGILVSGNAFKTIANALTQNLQPSPLIDATKPQPVHRLDYATTGILLIGKTSSCIRALNSLFEDKAVEKTYRAITIGQMPDHGTINSAIDGKSSHTNFELLASEPSQRFGQLNLVMLKPSTGRRHQLRKHLSSLGNPILGDKVYGIQDLVLYGKGLYLHAHTLQFLHPFTKKPMIFEDPLPHQFNKIFRIR